MNRLSARSLFRIPAAIAMATVLGLAPTSAAQTRTVRKVDPQAQLLNNYRKFPNRYIRISDETWKYDDTQQTAFHSFTLKNNAGVAYSGIQIQANYLNDDGKTLLSQVLNVPGTLAPYQTKRIKDIRTRKVPPQCTQAVISVKTASISP